MFCASLRRRPSLSPIIPTLIAAPLSLREYDLGSHDLEIEFGSHNDSSPGDAISARRLRVVLLSPADTSEGMMDEAMRRIHRFGALTGSQDVVIVLLVNPPPATSFTSARKLADPPPKPDFASIEGITAYSKLQALMFSNLTALYVPVLPLYRTEHLPQLLTRHVDGVKQPRAIKPPPLPAFELLKLCTANPPMSQQTAYILSDLFPDLGSLATACSSATSMTHTRSSPNMDFEISSQPTTQTVCWNADSPLQRLYELVGEDECKDIIDFWHRELLVD